MWKKILIIIAILLFISLIVYIAVIDYKNQNNVESNNLEHKKEVQKPQSENCIGTIEGEFMFPSSMIPTGSVVCAKNLETNNYYCTPNQIVDLKYRNKKGYKLEVPSGTYVVSGIFPFFDDPNTNLPFEYKYTGESCDIESCVDVNTSISVDCETISDIDLSQYGVLNIFDIFFHKK
jgi:hypothetical protein